MEKNSGNTNVMQSCMFDVMPVTKVVEVYVSQHICHMAFSRGHLRLWIKCVA